MPAISPNNNCTRDRTSTKKSARLKKSTTLTKKFGRFSPKCEVIRMIINRSAARAGRFVLIVNFPSKNKRDRANKISESTKPN